MDDRTGTDVRPLTVDGGRPITAERLRAASRRWRAAVRHLGVSLVIALAGYGALVLVAASAVLSLLGGLGLPLLARSLLVVRRVADAQRARLRIGSPHPALPAAPADRVRVLLTAPATRRDLLWAATPVQAGLALVGFSLCAAGLVGLLMPALRALLPGVPLSWFALDVVDMTTALAVVDDGVLVTTLALLAPPTLIHLETRFAGWLLAPSAAARLAARVERLERTRTDAVDASAVELRRIERDLHDGAQVRLVALAMNLGMAEDLLDTDPATAKALLADARSGAHTALAELRALVRGIHPPLLADRGIGGALEAVALASPVPVDLDLALPRRLPPPVESAGYFAVVEALTNAVKHSGASTIAVGVRDAGDRLLLRVADDGRGGADPARGTGLSGISRRLAAFDGTLTVSSPDGGPTVVEAVLPCAS